MKNIMQLNDLADYDTFEVYLCKCILELSERVDLLEQQLEKKDG